MRRMLILTVAAALSSACGSATPQGETPSTRAGLEHEMAKAPDTQGHQAHGHQGHGHQGHGHQGHGHQGHGHQGHGHQAHGHQAHGHQAHGHTEHGAAAHGGAGHHAFTDAEKWTQVFDDPARDDWQRPDAVIEAMALTPKQVVADVGAGTGYFAVRLAQKVPEGAVIGTDIEPDMVRFLNERAAREHLPNLSAVKATPTDSGLAAHSVDRVLVVNVWHHLENRVAYAQHLATTLRPGGKLYIVDFKRTATRGPPPEMRFAPEAIVAELEAAGLKATVLALELPEQYMVEAQPAR
jgi:tRNA G46 methylase TrmB